MPQRDLLAQRLYDLCCGVEDLNEHDTLRADLLMQTAVGRAEVLASSPTLCRLQNPGHASAGGGAARSADRAVHCRPQDGAGRTGARHRRLGRAGARPPGVGRVSRLLRQCDLPLDVFCGESLLACVLRRSRIDAAQHAAAVVKLLVTRLRQAWPGVRIIVRGDSGFCRQRLLRFCERAGVGYLIGLARNARLEARVANTELMLAEDYGRTGVKQPLIEAFTYAADSWNRQRRAITRLEYGAQGNNPRFVVTNLEAEAVDLYELTPVKRPVARAALVVGRVKRAQIRRVHTVSLMSYARWPSGSHSCRKGKSK